MSDRDRLVQRMSWALHAVHDSTGYEDTARQVIERLADLFPEDVDTARNLAEMHAEINGLRWARDSIETQYRAHMAHYHPRTP